MTERRLPPGVALLAALSLAACGTSAMEPSPVFSDARTPAQAGLVGLQARVSGIDLDIRYAGTDNFTGGRVEGYRAARCYLLAPVADALREVELELRARGQRLRVFDCYRPVRAVAHFMRWVGEGEDAAIRRAYHPDLDRPALRGRYIAPLSGHSRGATVDLTLLDCAGGACRPLDMGTPFDFFDPLANTDSPDITPVQRGNRQQLREAMERHGFHNYPMEWWHYTFRPEPSPDLYHDVPVE